MSPALLYSTINPPLNVPPYFKRKIDIIDNKGIKKNLKNLIIYILLLENKSLKFNDITNNIKRSHVFNKNSLFPKNIKLNLAELRSFEILIVDKLHESIEKQEFLLNISILPCYYGIKSNQLLEKLQNLFLSLNLKK